MKVRILHYKVQLNLSTMVNLGTEENGHCREEAVGGESMVQKWACFTLFYYFISFALKNTKKKNTVDMKTKYQGRDIPFKHLDL